MDEKWKNTFVLISLPLMGTAQRKWQSSHYTLGGFYKNVKFSFQMGKTGLPAAPLRATVVVCSSISLYSSIDAASDKSLAVLGIVSIQIQCDVWR